MVTDSLLFLGIELVTIKMMAQVMDILTQTVLLKGIITGVMYIHLVQPVFALMITPEPAVYWVQEMTAIIGVL